jgi:hypothetical protein
MKKIILGALVCAAVAGVIYYIQNPEKFEDTVDDLKDTFGDALDKAKKTVNKASGRAEKVEEAFS